jgi:PqqD family protein of HPr-rel-A system
MLSLDSNTSYYNFKEGTALFNKFTGNTHFLPLSLNDLITRLSEKPCSKEALLTSYLVNHHDSTLVSDEANKQFQQFITEALKSGIIVETK